jgi:hypothetical protein
MGDLATPLGAFATENDLYTAVFETVNAPGVYNFQLARFDDATTSFYLLPRIYDQSGSFARPSGLTFVIDRFANPTFATSKTPFTIRTKVGDYLTIDNPVFVWGRPFFEALSELQTSYTLNGAPVTTNLGTVERILEVYLMVLDGAALDFGEAKPWYFAGSSGAEPVWSNDPYQAAPLPGLVEHTWEPPNEIPVINQMSVRFDQRTKRWLMLYGGRSLVLPGQLTNFEQSALITFDNMHYFRQSLAVNTYDDTIDEKRLGLRLRTAPNPWGPWSSPIPVYNGFPSGKADCTLLYQQGGGEGCVPTDQAPLPVNPALPLDPTVYSSGGKPLPFHGAEYGTSIWHLDVDTPGVTTVYFSLSTYNPYHVVLMRVSLEDLPKPELVTPLSL